MALSLFAKALVGIFALQAKQAIGEPNKPAASVVYDAEGFGFTEDDGINAYGVEHSFGVGTFVTRDGTTTLEVKHGLCIIFARNGADLIERAEATSNPRATKRHLAKVFRRLAQTRDLDLVVDAASLTAAVLDTVLDALPTPAADDIVDDASEIHATVLARTPEQLKNYVLKFAASCDIVAADCGMARLPLLVSSNTNGPNVENWCDWRMLRRSLGDVHAAEVFAKPLFQSAYTVAGGCMIDLFHFMNEVEDGFTNAQTALGASASMAFYSMGIDNPNTSVVFRNDLHLAAFGGGVGAGHEVIALGAHAGGDDAALSATLEEKELEWFNQHVLHVAATDILSYLEILRAFLEYQHSRLNSATTTA